MTLKLRWLFILLFTASFTYAQSGLLHNEWIDYNKTYYKFKVMGFGLDTNNIPIRTGIVRIPYATLAGAGLSNVPAEQFQLWRDGEQVPVWVSKPTGTLGATDYIEFFGEINSGRLDGEMYRNPDYQLHNKWSFQTDTASYFLTVNSASSNLRYTDAANNASANTLPADSFFMYTMGRYFRNISNGFYASLGQNLYSSSYDKGEGFVSRAVRPVGGGCGSATLPQIFVRLYPFLNGPDATIRVNAVGDMQNSRTFRVDLNGDSIATYQMDYINYVKAEEQVSASKLSSGSASFAIVNKSPQLCDEMRVGMIEITYPRRFHFDYKSVFSFTLDSSSVGRYLAITGFNHGGVAPVLYDYANNKRYIGDITTPDTVKILLGPSAQPYQLVLTTQNGSYYKAIASLNTRNFIDYGSAANQGDYLIISNPLIYGTGTANYVEQYRQYRSSAVGGGYNAKVIDIEQLTDQFAWGVKKHPLSIKNFLKYAKQTFATAPKFVFLIGKGVTYNDYRTNESNALADQLNLVPTWGNPASDNLLSSASNVNATPDIPIGRLSAVSAQEVGEYLAKVKQHDSAQRATVYSLDAKGWMKNVLQIAGANDIGLGNQLDGYLNNYKSIISDTSFGARVIDFSKTANPAGYTEAVASFKNNYENGASLITYFGHSSATSLDFNLDNPNTYNNFFKYPVFIANGCSAGNHFTFETNRMNGTSTISEKFILAPQRGAIGYLASTHYGVINYLDLYTKDFYKAMGQTKYNKPVGEVVKEAIRSSLASTGLNDYYSRVHAEQYAFHGDPAIMINSASQPDYVMEPTQIQVSPSFISTGDSTFFVKVRVNNIGKAVNDSVTLKVQRQIPNGNIYTLLTKTFPSINLIDSVTLEVPIVGDRDKGSNTIIAAVDYNNAVPELTETNNSASTQFTISEDEIRPVFPYKYTIIDQPNIKPAASTVNPLGLSKQYQFELDTTALFNSPAKISVGAISTGGVIEFDPGINYTPDLTYYWRVSSVSADPHWISSSFVYKPGVSGFEQSHLYQHLQSSLTRLSLDSTTRSYKFQDKLHNLFITNSIYPTSGTEDGHFSVSVDGTTSIRSACAGSSVIFNLFDSLTFQPKLNTTQPFNSAAVCAAGREYNFEYQYRTAATRKNAMDFIDAIPNGTFVSVRLVLDAPYNSWAANWAADTTLYGSGNSLYHRLKKHGFTSIDSFYYARTWAFVFRKGDTTFTPRFVLSQGVYDRINLSVKCVTPNTDGYITSPVFGPAKQWKSINWAGYSNEAGNDVTSVDVYGIKADKTDTLLYTLDTANQTFNIAALSPADYPFLRLKLNNKDSVTATPYQMTKWNITYNPAPEGALAPNLYLDIPDTVTMFTNPGPNGARLHVGVAFKNVSKADFAPLALKVVLFDTTESPYEIPVDNLRALPAGDSLHIDLDIDVSFLQGKYNLYLEVNPNGQQAEQYRFNNILYKYVYIDNGRTLPVAVDFKARLTGDKVTATWNVSQDIKVRSYEVEHGLNPTLFRRIGSIAAVGSAGAQAYSLDHLEPAKGKNYYRLKMLNKDGSFEYSPVRVVELNALPTVSVYPNPVKDRFTVAVTGTAGKPVTGRVVDPFGRTVKQLVIGEATVVNSAGWPAGVYLMQIDLPEGRKTMKIQKQ